MSKDWTQEKAIEVMEAEITALRAENEKLRKDLSMSVFSDSEYCKVLEGEQERLLKSRNRWAQKYNNLLNEKRAEDGYDVYAAAREEYRKKIAEQAAENEKLRAKIEHLCKEVNYAKYGNPDFAWSLYEAQMNDLRLENEKLRKLLNMWGGITPDEAAAAIRALKEEK